MKLIDRYVTEVGKHLLLAKERKDIEKELHTTLENMLNDRAQKTGRAADEAMEIELLRDYGPPQKTAAEHNPYPYLIGPRMFPMFIRILQIVIAAVTLAMIIVTGIEIITQSPMTAMELLKIIGQGLLNIISASIAAFGNIALIFALIERFAPISEFKMDEDKEWDPASLRREPAPEDIKIWEPIAAIVFTFIAISIFNFNPQLIRLYNFSDGVWTATPILTEAFFRWLPLINISWVAEIILNGMLLRAGRWQVSTRLFSIIIKAFQIVIITLLLTGPSILAITPKSLEAGGVFDADTAQVLGTMTQQGIRIALGLAIFGTVIEIIKSVYKLFIQKSSTSV